MTLFLKNHTACFCNILMRFSSKIANVLNKKLALVIGKDQTAGNSKNVKVYFLYKKTELQENALNLNM